MNRADPTAMRKSLQAVEQLRNAGILFVPMPVADQAEFDRLAAEMMEKLERMAQESGE